jgi:hypothetical protein
MSKDISLTKLDGRTGQRIKKHKADVTRSNMDSTSEGDSSESDDTSTNSDNDNNSSSSESDSDNSRRNRENHSQCSMDTEPVQNVTRKKRRRQETPLNELEGPLIKQKKGDRLHRGKSFPESTATAATYAQQSHTFIQQISSFMNANKKYNDENTIRNEDDVPSYDQQLLRSLAQSSYSRPSDVNWNAVRYPLGNAKDRWQTLVDKWIESSNIDEDDVMDKPIREVAREILKQGLETT